MNRHPFHVSAAVMALVSISGQVLADGRVPLNSLSLEVNNYIHSTGGGKFEPYSVLGFRQPVTAGGAGVKPKMRLVPELRVPSNGVRYVSTSGMNITPTDCTQQPVRTIDLTVRIENKLPTESQKNAVGAATLGIRVERELIAWPTTPMGPVKWPGTPDPMAIDAIYNLYTAELTRRQDWSKEYDKYDVSMVVLEDLALDLSVDGAVISTTRYPGSMAATSGSTLRLTLRNPDAYTCNRILNGAYEVIARYRFNDTGSAQINAKFEVRSSLTNFIKETQTATARSKTSGWKILGIGSRRSKMKSSLESTMTVENNSETIERTTIVMSDANKELIERFESVFFPRLSKQEAIDNHLKAAAEAEASNRPDLAKAHLAYVAALTNGREDLETDAIGAAAALNDGDYATFVAKGVRFSDNDDSRTDSFRRTLDVSVNDDVIREWSQSQSVTKVREASTPILKSNDLRSTPYFGLTGAPIQYRFLTEFNGWEPRESLLVGAIDPTGPLATAGLLPGMIIHRVGSTRVSTLTDVEDALKFARPGQTVSVEILERTGFFLNNFNYQTGKMIFRNVTVGSMPMVVSGRNDR